MVGVLWVLLHFPVLITSFEIWCSRCEWVLKVHPVGVPHDEDKVIDDDFEPMSPLDELLSKWDWKLDDQARGVPYTPYSYVLRINLSDNALTRRVIQYGIQPIVEMVFWPNSPQNGSVAVTFPAMLVDWAQLHDGYFADCEEEYCNPVWVAPLPIGSLYNIQGKVTSSGIGHILADQKFAVGSSFFGYLLVKETDYDVKSAFQQLDHITMSYLQGIATTKVFPLMVDQNHLIVASQDDFKTYLFLKVPDDITSEVGSCTCADALFHVATAAHRMLFQLKSGIYELKETKTKAGKEIFKQLDVCTRAMMLPSEDILSFHQYAIAEGACAEEGKLYVYWLDRTPGSLEKFAPLTDSAGRHVCEALHGVKACSIVSSAVSANHKGSAIVLLDLIVEGNAGTADTQEYWLVDISFATESESKWLVLNKLPKWMEVSTQNSTSSQPYLNPHSNNTAGTQQVELKLQGIALTPWLSPNIVLYGNRILKSPDYARNFYLYPDELNVTQVEITKAGSILMLTQEGQLIVGSVSTSSFVQLYPSNSWSMLHTLQPALLNDDLNILTIFQDTVVGHVYFLVYHGDELRSLPIPMQDLLALNELRISLEAQISVGLTSDTLNIGTSKCPYSDIYITTLHPQLRTKIKTFYVAEPHLSSSSLIHKNTSIMVMSALMHNLQYWIGVYGRITYKSDFACPYEQWKSMYIANKDYSKYLFQNKLQYDNVLFSFDGFNCASVEEERKTRKLPSVFYLDYGEVLTLIIEMHENPAFGLKKNHPPDLYSMDLSTIVSDMDLVSLQTKRTDNVGEKVSTFEIIIEATGSVGTQQKPGVELSPVSINIQAWNAPLHCFERLSSSETREMGIYEADIMVGCPPNQRIMFDWKVAWERSDNQEVREQPFDCLYTDPDLPCFYFHNGFYPVFTVFDESMNTFTTYEGNYTLIIIGGSLNSKDDIKLFSEEEIYDYNNQNGKKPSKIWGPTSETALYHGWPVFTRNNSDVSWFCQPKSPCANVLPNMPENPDYYFLVQFSNKEVGSSTHCDLTFEFVIHIYGLPLHSIKVSLVIIMVTYLLLTLISLFYFICNNEQNDHTRRLRDRMRSLCRRSDRVVLPQTRAERELVMFREQMLPLLTECNVAEARKDETRRRTPPNTPRPATKNMQYLYQQDDMKLVDCSSTQILHSARAESGHSNTHNNTHQEEANRKRFPNDTSVQLGAFNPHESEDLGGQEESHPVMVMFPSGFSVANQRMKEESVTIALGNTGKSEDLTLFSEDQPPSCKDSGDGKPEKPTVQPHRDFNSRSSMDIADDEAHHALWELPDIQDTSPPPNEIKLNSRSTVAQDTDKPAEAKLKVTGSSSQGALPWGQNKKLYLDVSSAGKIGTDSIDNMSRELGINPRTGEEEETPVFEDTSFPQPSYTPSPDTPVMSKHNAPDLTIKADDNKPGGAAALSPSTHLPRATRSMVSDSRYKCYLAADNDDATKAKSTPLKPASQLPPIEPRYKGMLPGSEFGQWHVNNGDCF